MTPITIMPGTRPPTSISLPLFVLIVSAEPPLKLAVTGEAVFASKTFIQLSAEPLTGMLVVA
ncbi:hypothetical protein D3C87_1434990 [compost metagenome]